ncbi:acetyl-CoA synthetase-like protein [Tothia fuscella]|uniref:Acetyl-CoA synthetase-like protein n=1 Tax=Tothia fuscella TaxID=1048955 RepID=A0A9P4P422_9PEZI|nr:acetyl-CoA synthetase-like protein [Tothia fuscella]
MAGAIEQLDEYIGELFSGWNIYSTLLAIFIAGYLVYTIAAAQDPDTHPMILQRQASPSYVRNPGESAVYRSPDVPHGYPLRTGLNVKTPGAPAYSGGKDGDLRDIWRRVTGEIPLEQPRGTTIPTTRNGKGKILTVFGKEQVIEHDINSITKDIAVVGESIQKHGGTRVAIYLPNSVEFLAALFSCAFYGFTPILLPYNQPHETTIDLLKQTNADVLIAEAGSLPLQDLTKTYKSLKQVIWVVEESSRHMDWTEIPNDIGGKIDVSVWHQLVQDHQETSATLPNLRPEELGKIVTVWLGKPGSPAQIVEFTHRNFVAAISALTYAIPLRQRLNPSDMFLAADSFTNTHTLCLTLSALFSHATVAINSVAGPGVKLSLASRNISPTVIVASAETAAQLHAENSTAVASGVKKLTHGLQTSVLDAGRMPVNGLLTSINAPHRAALGTTPGKLRLVFVAERAGAECPPLSSHDLTDIRVFTGARVIYALTDAKVAGAVAQTSVFDYRREGASRNKHSHFGAPLSSVEIRLVDTDVHKTSDESAKGEIVVSGPAVAGGEARLGVSGTFRDDSTLAYI